MKEKKTIYSEKTLRKRAKAIGYSIHKGLQHEMCVKGCPVAYGRTVGYMVMDDSTGYYIWGSYDNVYDYRLDLVTIHECLNREYKKLGLVF